MVNTFSTFYDTIYTVMLKFFDFVVSFWSSINNTTIEDWCKDNLNLLDGIFILEWIGDALVAGVVEILDAFDITDLTIFEFLIFGFVSVMVVLFIARLVS